RAFAVSDVNGQPPISTSGCLWCDDGAVHTITTGFQSAYTITGNALDFQKFTVGGNGSIVSRGVVGSGAVLTIIEDGVGGSSTTLGASSSFGHSGAVGTLTNHNFGFYTNTQLAGYITNGQVWNIGLTGTRTGQMGFSGATSGTATITAQAAAGSPTLTLPNTSGTIPSTVANETNITLALNTTTGQITPGWQSTLARSRGGTGNANGAFIVTKITRFTANGTYTPTAGMLYVIFECLGGGGGGGGVVGSATASRGGGGGGSGSYSRVAVSAAQVTGDGGTEAITIGPGGNGGAAGANNGSAGTDTSVGSRCVGKG